MFVGYNVVLSTILGNIMICNVFAPWAHLGKRVVIENSGQTNQDCVCLGNLFVDVFAGFVLFFLCRCVKHDSNEKRVSASVTVDRMMRIQWRISFSNVSKNLNRYKDTRFLYIYTDHISVKIIILYSSTAGYPKPINYS